jgi:hypothetical protein
MEHIMSLTLQRILNEHFDAFAATRKLSRDMLCAAWRVRHCRTHALGGHINSCPEGHFHQIAYNSCLHRSCPQCAWSPRQQWLDGWKQRLLRVPHHHIVFTIPHSLNDLWRFNKRTFSTILFDAASQTLSELLADPKYLAARPGILAALHTWNQKLDIHVHLHVLVTAGGLNESGQWIKPQKSCLLPRKVLMIKFRGKFKAMLRAAIASGKLRLPTKVTPEAMNRVFSQLNATPWNVKIHDVYGHGDGVATYLAHYIKGGPIGNSRLLSMEDGRVRFRYRLSELEGGDGKARGTTSLPVFCFIGRWLEHVPPRRFQTVRGYGLYSGNQHSQLAEARASLGMSDSPTDIIEDRTWQARCEAAGFTSACRCPKCGATLVSHGHFAAGRSPPLRSFRRRLTKEAA